MNIHEYQAKELLVAQGIPVPMGEVATTPEEAEAITRRLGGNGVVIKAQVHAGGRGKAGGVKLAKTPAEAKEVAAKILALEIKGLPVEKVLITPNIAGGSEVNHLLNTPIIERNIRCFLEGKWDDMTNRIKRPEAGQ